MSPQLPSPRLERVSDYGLAPGRYCAPLASLTISPRLQWSRRQNNLVREIAGLVLLYELMCHLGVAFSFRKGDQPEGVSFYTLSTPGK